MSATMEIFVEDAKSSRCYCLMIEEGVVTEIKDCGFDQDPEANELALRTYVDLDNRDNVFFVTKDMIIVALSPELLGPMLEAQSTHEWVASIRTTEDAELLCKYVTL